MQSVAPAQQGHTISEWGCDFAGVNGDPQVLLELEIQSTAGTGGSALTPDKWNPNDAQAIQTGGQQNITGTHPTKSAGAGIQQVKADGAICEQLGPGREIFIPGGLRFGIVATAVNANTVVGHIHASE